MAGRLQTAILDADPHAHLLPDVGRNYAGLKAHGVPSPKSATFVADARTSSTSNFRPG
jgi:hypothetical protein